ncbi:hypothetical protein OOJ96_09960 [Pseudomonas sp. 15FMM2]|uniref:Uncharacterized protein n=1 Tax=Pseudomonas imrae TaxID=2992837 RepID=A0ACC7PBT6_9PSED
MMLLRTLVLEQSGHDAPVNGALLCCFAVPQLSSNYLAYSLDEEMEPGSARVYIAALRKKSERYFLGGIDSKDDLQVAMRVFKQILTLAAATGTKDGNVAEPQVPYHFIDLKGCKLPPARPEDHHSLMIKKALVMKLISLGTSVIGLPAIESSELIVPSIRFSSKMVSPIKTESRPESETVALLEEPQVPMSGGAEALPDEKNMPTASLEPSMAPVINVPLQPVGEDQACSPEPDKPLASIKEDQASLFDVDNTLTNLARLAQELTQEKLAVIKQQAELEQLRGQLQKEKAALEQSNRQTIDQDAALQQLARSLSGREEALGRDTQVQQAEQRRLEDWARQLENESFRLQAHDLEALQKQEQLSAGLAQVSKIRDSLKDLLFRLDGTLAGVVIDRKQECGPLGSSASD